MIAPVSDAEAATMSLDDYGPLEPPVGTALDGPMTFPPHWTGVWTLAAPMRKLSCTFRLGD